MTGNLRSLDVGGLRFVTGPAGNTGGAAGEGQPPLVLLHPWFGSWRFWLPVLDLLPARPWYAADFYSLSRSPETTATPQAFADRVRRLAGELGVKQIDLAGNSVGGIVAQIVASEYPGLVRRMVLIGTGARTAGNNPRFADQVQAWVEGSAGNARADIELVTGMLASAPIRGDIRDATVDAIAATPREYVAGVLDACRNLDLRPELPKIAAPTLVVRGELDCARTPAHVRELLDGIAGAVAAELPGAGHSPMLDHPVQTAALLNDHFAAKK